MELIIKVEDKNLYEKILSFLNNFKEDVKIVKKRDINKQNAIDFSVYKIESLKEIDGVEYQKKIRDEW